MPELSDLLKASIGDVPAFDAGALATRARRQRRRQIGVGGGLAAVAAAIAVALFIGPGSGPGVQVRAGAGPSTAASSTTDGATTTLSYDSSSAPITSPNLTTTLPRPTATTAPTLTTAPGERGPRSSDFTGTVTSDATTLVVDSTTQYNQDVARVDLWVRNVSADVVDAGGPDGALGLLCAPLAIDGTPTIPVSPDVNFWFATIPPLKPGDVGGRSGTFVPTAEYVGTVTCEAVIVQLDPAPQTVTFVAAVPGVQSVSITVEPAGTTTTSTTTTGPPPSS